MEPRELTFRCTKCDREHSLDEVSFGANEPVQWLLLSDDEQSRSFLSDEVCEIESEEGKSFYVRACLEIPIRGANLSFTWGVWCSLSEKSYRVVAEHWDDAE
jgi:hypothetical protein